MNANRKADLQRKLTMAPVPDPPAGLAERIKGDIPPNLRFDLEKDRERMSDSVGLIMRVAASVLVVVSMAFFAMQILSRSSEKKGEAMAVDSIALQSRGARTAAPTATIAEAKELVPAADPVPNRPPAATRRPRASSDAVMSGGIAQVPMRQEIARDQVAALKSEDVPPPISETSAAAMSKTIAAEPLPPVAENIVVTAAAPVMAPAPAAAPAAPQQAQANEAALLDRRKADGFKDADASSRVARFAAPRVIPAGDLRVDLEAVQSPFATDRVLLRFSVDSGLAASDLRVDVLLGEDVSDKRWLAGSWRWTAALFDRQSSTSVAEMTAGATADSPVAIARVNYRTRDGEQTIEKTLRRNDVKSWSAASSRTKAAILAAKSADPALRRQAADLARDAGLLELAAEIEKR